MNFIGSALLTAILVTTFVTVFTIVNSNAFLTTSTKQQCIVWVMPTEEHPENPWCATEIITITRSRIGDK